MQLPSNGVEQLLDDQRVCGVGFADTGLGRYRNKTAFLLRLPKVCCELLLKQAVQRRQRGFFIKAEVDECIHAIPCYLA